MSSKKKSPTSPRTNPQTLKIGSGVRCTEDGVEGRIVWANAAAVKIRWQDGEQVTWRRDALAGKAIEFLAEGGDENPSAASVAADANTATAPREPSPQESETASSAIVDETTGGDNRTVQLTRAPVPLEGDGGGRQHSNRSARAEKFYQRSSEAVSRQFRGSSVPGNPSPHLVSTAVVRACGIQFSALKRATIVDETTGGDDRTVQLTRAPVPLEGDPVQIALWAEVLTGMSLDVHDQFEVHDGGTLLARRRELETKEALLPELRPPVGSILP